jgi:VanZ family protein
MTSAHSLSVLMTFTFIFTQHPSSLSGRIAPLIFGFVAILWFLPCDVSNIQKENRPEADP